MANWVHAVWLPAGNSLSPYERRLSDLISLTGMDTEELEQLISERANTGLFSPVEVAEWFYNHYLMFGQLPAKRVEASYTRREGD